LKVVAGTVLRAIRGAAYRAAKRRSNSLSRNAHAVAVLVFNRQITMRGKLTRGWGIHPSAELREISLRTDYKAEIDRHFAWFEGKLPPKPAKFIGWLRKPSSQVVRIPVAILLVAGGALSFLPILGLWMLPLGLVLIAQDVPLLEKPTALSLGWIERKWDARQRAKEHKK
jgi:hypothetical protein